MTNKEPDEAEVYHDGNEKDIKQKQSEEVTDSQAIRQDSDIDVDAVNVLPGTGGPDDVGDMEVEPDDYNRSGH